MVGQAYGLEVYNPVGGNGVYLPDTEYFAGQHVLKANTAIIELLDMDDNLRDKIVSKAPVSQLKDAARATGTVFLRGAAVEKLLHGVTTLEEINRVTFVEASGGEA